MRRKSLMAVAAAALCAWAAARAARPAGAPRPAGGGEAPATAVSGQGPSSLPARWGLLLVPAPNAEAESPNGPPKVGAELARSYRDDVCGCQTKACWKATSAGYRSSVGLAVAQADGEGPVIDAAFREASSCIRRIYAADAIEHASHEPSPDASPLPTVAPQRAPVGLPNARRSATTCTLPTLRWLPAVEARRA